jgi:hypothetical protein
MSLLITKATVLGELVRRFKICWEVWPEYAAAVGQKSRHVGFELELLGSDRSVGEFDPSCPKSAEIHAALDEIARWILEIDEQVSFQINDNRQSLCYARARGNRADVTLSIQILSRKGFANSVDESERNCLERAQARLRGLGAYEHQWHLPPASNARVSAAA